jgi:NAD(P)-dependent dehydrogenase (short-subunit alcohol dehydrogenase family)
MKIDLTGRVAVVTGAATGIGAAASRMLAAAGADLLLHYRSHSDWLDAVVADVRAAGRRVEIVQADFATDEGAAARVVATAAERLGRVDILVNNAAVTTQVASVADLKRSALAEVLDVNVTAPFLAAQAAAPHMAKEGAGRIINIGSVHAIQSAPGYLAYEASKGAITTMTASLALELGKLGITVNCIAPGAIVVERYGDIDLDKDWYVSRTPVGRMGAPDDIASTICFLASDQASFITGETIVVDGGMTRRMGLVR